MTYKAFVTWAGIQLDGDGLSRASFYAIVFDNVGNIYDHPLAPGNSYNSSIVINYSSTLSTLRTAAQNDIIDAYGFTPTFIWLDDKGLL